MKSTARDMNADLIVNIALKVDYGGLPRFPDVHDAYTEQLAGFVAKLSILNPSLKKDLENAIFAGILAGYVAGDELAELTDSLLKINPKLAAEIDFFRDKIDCRRERRQEVQASPYSEPRLVEMISEVFDVLPNSPIVTTERLSEDINLMHEANPAFTLALLTGGYSRIWNRLHMRFKPEAPQTSVISDYLDLHLGPLCKAAKKKLETFVR